MNIAIGSAALALIGFVLTQSILKFVIEPIQEQRKLIGEVANAIVVYANVYVDDSWKNYLERSEQSDRLKAHLEKTVEVANTLRGFSGRLRATLWSIPIYSTFARMGLVRKPTDILEASSAFIYWSNALVGAEASDNVRQAQDIIATKLGIEQKYRNLQSKS
jgi:hypothetical protein